LSEIWSFIETREGVLAGVGRQMASESRRTARITGWDPCGLLYGPCSPEAAEELKWYGLKKLYLLPGGPMAAPETVSAAIYSAVLKYVPNILLFAASPVGEELAARTASLLKRGIISRCTDFELQGEILLARKTVYQGRADAIMTWTAPPPCLATLDLPALEDVRERAQNEPEIRVEAGDETAPRTRLLKRWEVALNELDLTEARIIIGVGRGVSPDYMETVRRLAEWLKGVVGGTRIAVYSGLIPLDRQIGTTGKWISSDIYLTIGISGAPQHVMGIKEVRNIIAINISRDAPILKYARLGIIGDLYRIVPALMNLIQAEK
jgi:electron transfer flavoprotein alpha subunit